MVSSGKISLEEQASNNESQVPPSSTKTLPTSNTQDAVKTKATPPPKQHTTHHKHHHHHHHVAFEKERAKLVDVIRGKREKPVSVSSKYPESIVDKTHILGKGFFGVVYKGEDVEIDQKFAIKIVDREILVNGNKDQVEMLKKEFKREQRVRVC